jgi:hypothetical protein
MIFQARVASDNETETGDQITNLFKAKKRRRFEPSSFRSASRSPWELLSADRGVGKRLCFKSVCGSGW